LNAGICRVPPTAQISLQLNERRRWQKMYRHVLTQTGNTGPDAEYFPEDYQNITAVRQHQLTSTIYFTSHYSLSVPSVL